MPNQRFEDEKVTKLTAQIENLVKIGAVEIPETRKATSSRRRNHLLLEACAFQSQQKRRLDRSLSMVFGCEIEWKQVLVTTPQPFCHQYIFCRTAHEGTTTPMWCPDVQQRKPQWCRVNGSLL